MAPLSQQQQHSQQQQQYTVGFLKPDVMDRQMELMKLVSSQTLWTVTFEKELELSLDEAQALYPQKDIASWLSSRNIYVFVLKGQNVVKHWYKFAGPKDPAKAKQTSPQSLRAMYGLDELQNVCHASTSGKEAQRDLNWLRNLVPDLHDSIPLDIGIASSPKQRHHGASTNPSSTNVAAPNNSKTSVATRPAAAGTTKHLSTASEMTFTSSSSSPGTRNKSMTDQSMPRTIVDTSLATTSSMGSRPRANGNRTPQSQSGITKQALSKTTKTRELTSNKRLPSNKQHVSKTTPGIPVGLKQRKDTIATVTPINNNDSHVQPQQQQHAIKTITCNPSQNSQFSNADAKENGTVDASISPSSIHNILDYMENNDTTDEYHPYATTTISSSYSLASTSTSTLNSDHHEKDMITPTMPASAMKEHVKNNTITIVAPNNPLDNVNRSTISDVASLRHEFEAHCQSKAVTRTPSVTNTTHLSSRIKDLKPKNPSGSRVKSMVAFFMDENLHKWEF